MASLILKTMESVWIPGIPPILFNLFHQTPPYNSATPLLTHRDIHKVLSSCNFIGPELYLQSALKFIMQAGLLTCLRKPPQDPPSTGFSIEGFRNLATNPTDPFEILPIEIISIILHYVDVWTIGQAERVSKKWQRYIP